MHPKTLNQKKINGKKFKWVNLIAFVYSFSIFFWFGLIQE
jgi:hypothetical protein